MGACPGPDPNQPWICPVGLDGHTQMRHLATMNELESPVRVAAFYRFADLQDFREMRDALRDVAESQGVRGTILMASEGVNGTIAGSADGVEAVLDHLRSDPRLADLTARDSETDSMPFRRLRVRLKKEIVTLGQPGVNPNEIVGTYVDPKDWNAVIDDPDTIVIDARNAYEVAIGTFEGAIDPDTESFRELPDWINEHEEVRQAPRVAMFCTGGIRCEKSTSWLKAQGVREVLHLQGGILNYLEKIPEAESKWQGDCFVFDDRVSVRHGLVPGDYSMCRACGGPIAPEDVKSLHFERGVSCPACIDTYTDDDRARFRMRQGQLDQAETSAITDDAK